MTVNTELGIHIDKISAGKELIFLNINNVD